MKSEEVQRLACEFAKVTRDACLCDKCFRFIDRGAKTKRKEKLNADKGELELQRHLTKIMINLFRVINSFYFSIH